MHDHVGVVDDVEAEEDCAADRDHKVQHRISQEQLERGCARLYFVLKVHSYIAQYPVLGTALSTLHPG